MLCNLSHCIGSSTDHCRLRLLQRLRLDCAYQRGRDQLRVGRLRKASLPRITKRKTQPIGALSSTQAYQMESHLQGH
uniref:Uncharacterized protein n=1 Tax=Rodentolepis nana TaxID=102285 RepID=A0A0R3T0J8_RODNA